MMAQYLFFPHLEATWEGHHTNLDDPTAMGMETDYGFIILEHNLRGQWTNKESNRWSLLWAHQEILVDFDLNI